jgi:tetratricopeptide (TPR) repeat protein
MNYKVRAIIGRGAHDLPEHLKGVEDACLRQGMLPVMTEDLLPSAADAISTSLALVDEAEIYLGLFAYRYGYVPQKGNPRKISLTEMEYDRAVERNMKRIIFLMDKAHPITIDDVELGEGAEKLKALKERVQAENVVNFFKSPSDLHAQLITALSRLRSPDLTTFHYVSDIPEPPEAFIAHPYTLLQTHRLVGRLPELNALTDWVTRIDSQIYWARVLNVVAVGGMGKSALTWKWFNDIAPQEMSPLAGRLWWSFYESDATFENFVARALAYVARRPIREVQQIPAPDRESQLLAALDREPFLVVLDGLERILTAYARMDAARLEDSQVGGRVSLRKTADPRAGRFLKKLAQVRTSRILVSTRLYPADLETESGEPVPGSFRFEIGGLTDEDAIELWRAFNVTGARDILLPTFATIDKHPLLIQALAGEVKRYRLAPGNFEEWRKSNPLFDPVQFPQLHDAMSHVLVFALRGLDERARQVLRVIAAFRMPATYDTLTALLVGSGEGRVERAGDASADERKLFREEAELISALTELEDRGLVGWDRRANRYDLHPIVRGVVWNSLGDDARRGVYTSLHAHFEAVPMINDPLQVNSLEDLTPAIELYNTLIGLGRYEDAFTVFRDRISDVTLYRLSANQQRVELLELLFPDGLDQLPRLSSPGKQAYTFNALAAGYHFIGQPGRAAPLFRRVNTITTEMRREDNLSVGLGNLSDTLRLSGAIYESEAAARRALIIAREQDHRFWEAVNLDYLGLTLAARGVPAESKSALQRSLRLFVAQSHSQMESVTNSYLAQRSLWLGKFAAAMSFANHAWELAHVQNLERDFIYAARRQGEAALGLDDYATADERLHHALTRARKVTLIEEELPALVGLAELRRRQGDMRTARELLDDAWEAAERGPYPLFHADACNVLAQIEVDAGLEAAAVEAATKAYRLAWCDGPPFAYHWGLEKARKLLQKMGAGEPQLPAFDESKFEPMPAVESVLNDEFRPGEGGL